MTTSSGDIIGLITMLLADKGYRFHHGNGIFTANVGVELRDATGSLDAFDEDIDGVWFTWGGEGMSSYEVGDTCQDIEGAYESALRHFFANTDIPLHMGPDEERGLEGISFAEPALVELDETEHGTYTFEHGGVAIHDPMSSECGRFRYAVNQDESIPRGYGFDIIETGGGCTAWARDFTLYGRAVQMLVTDTGGLNHAIEVGEDSLIGVYAQDSENFVTWTQKAESTMEESPPENIVRQGEMPGQTEARLCAELNAFCKEHNLTPASADDLRMLLLPEAPEDDTEELKALRDWLQDFDGRWDVAVEAGLM